MTSPLRPRRAPLLAAVLALALVPAAAALAQYGPPQGPPGPSGAPPALTPQAQMQSQAERLRAQLSLRPNQDPALQAYVRAIQPPPGAMQRMREEEQSAARLPTPQRLDFALARMDRMRALMTAYAAATKAFYAQLTPTQQHTFDTLQPPGSGR